MSDPRLHEDKLGASARGKPLALRFLPSPATAEQREAARASALYQQGDMRLVWVNEGDLTRLMMGGEAISYGK